MEPTIQEPQILSNEEVRFSIHQKPSCVIEFDVEASEKLVREAQGKAIKRVSKEVSLPGFRKGKAPEDLILKKYEPQVNKEWEHLIADIAFSSCQKLARIPLLHRDSKVTYKMKSYTSSGALLTLTFETEPTIPSVDTEKFQLTPVKRPEVNEEKVNETIRQVQLFFAEWTSVTDRPAQEGDFVLLDVDVIEETPPTPLFSHTRFEVKQKSMAQWMYDLVLGKQVGESIEGTSVPDADASEDDKASLKPKKVRVSLRAIDIASLPSLDDAFVQKVGAQSIEDLHQKISQLLNRQADDHVREAEREQASDFLLNEYPFDLPTTLIDKETQFRVEQLQKDTDFINYWKTLSNEDKKKTFQTIRDQSTKAVRMFYLCRKIVSDARISISPNDLPPPATSTLEFLLNPQKRFHHAQNTETEHAEAFSRLVLEKAEDHLIAHAKK